MQLLGDVEAGSPIFDHGDDAAQVPLRALQPVDDLRVTCRNLGFRHISFLSSPGGYRRASGQRGIQPASPSQGSPFWQSRVAERGGAPKSMDPWPSSGAPPDFYTTPSCAHTPCRTMRRTACQAT